MFLVKKIFVGFFFHVNLFLWNVEKMQILQKKKLNPQNFVPHSELSVGLLPRFQSLVASNNQKEVQYYRYLVLAPCTD